MEQNHAEKTKAELAKIDKSIRRANKAVMLWMGLWATVYFGWFFYNRGIQPPLAAASWGVMGDFFGGFLNPVVAYFAFFWLTKSVRLQKEELAETRQALSEAANAQREQVALANTSVRLNALSALTNSIMNEVATQRDLLKFYVDQIHPGANIRSINGTGIGLAETMQLLGAINNRITARMTERLAYEEEISALLRAHPLRPTQSTGA